MIRCPKCGNEFLPATKPLTKKQYDLFRWIESTIRAEGVAPSVAEIAAAFNLAMGTTHEHLVNLEAKGVLVRGSAPRSMRLLARSDELVDELQVPAPATLPIDGDEDDEL